MEYKKISYCSNCGAKLIEGARFCPNCAAPVNPTLHNQGTTPESAPEVSQVVPPSSYSERKQEFAGRIIKCPSCGEELPSFTAICPSCGHEINSQSVSSSLKEFINSINACDRAIANNPEPAKTGWSTWGKGAKFWWVVLNIFTFCIPLVIYLSLKLIKPFLFPKRVPKLSPDEKRKASLIENATFPNERESILEALIFTKSKMDFLSSEKFNNKTQYWTNLWFTKAEQLHQKAGMLLNGDKIAEKTYNEIIECKIKVQKSVNIRAIIGTIIIVLYVSAVAIFQFGFGGIFGVIPKIEPLKYESNGTASFTEESFEWLTTGLSTKIPKIDEKSGHYVTNTDSELLIDLDNISYSEYNQYVSSCEKMGYTVEAKNDTNSYDAFNDEGYLLNLSYYDSLKRLRIELNAPLAVDEDFTWPDNKLSSMIPKLDNKKGAVKVNTEETLEINLSNITEDEVDSYISDCEDAGFTIDVEKKKSSFDGFNKDGYHLIVSLNEMKTMNITIEAPEEYAKISWPTSGPATLIPKPSSDTGRIANDYDWCFNVYISNMTKDEFNAYIDECIEAGFEKDSRDDNYFHAKKDKDIRLSVKYEGYNIVNIDITTPMK